MTQRDRCRTMLRAYLVSLPANLWELPVLGGSKL